MDKTTVAGMLAGFLLLGAAMGMGAGGLKIFWNMPALMITGGATFAAVMINFTLPEVVRVVKVLRVVFKADRMSYSSTIDMLVSASETARKEGLLSLETMLGTVDDKFLKSGLQLVVDGAAPEFVKEVLQSEQEFQAERHRVGQSVFEKMGIYAPAFGMAGTLIGLVRMLLFMDDAAAIGPAMAVALLTTFYGVLMANLICLPVAGKLKILGAEENLLRAIMIEGILCIQQGDNPRLVKKKLECFLPPNLRESA